ncbi:MAG: hypothetical protein ACRECZ_00035, partial [Methylocella sp.]
MNVGEIEFDGHDAPLDADDARRLRGSGEVIGLIYGDEVPEGGVELRRRRRVYYPQMVTDREASENPLQVEGLENGWEIR